MNKAICTFIALLLVTSLAACAPEIGSVEWCEDMDEKEKGDWSSNEAAEYAKNCIFRK